VFYEPLLNEDIQNGRGFTVEKMRKDHLDLYRYCYEINFRQVPKLYWDNQRCGGVSWMKRAMIRMLGLTEVRAWRKKFDLIERQIARRSRHEERMRHAG
jgi:hypothetical protein